jgi:pimeloyl-ACP methyl ester carboxylesterase
MIGRLMHGPLTTSDGWQLQVRRLVGAGAPGQPVILVPGFAMNSSIFSWHASGPSLMQHLLDAGYDPWTVDLRGSSPTRGRGRVSMQHQAFVDLPAAFDHVRNKTGRSDIVAVGCSLGGALLYGALGRGAIQASQLVTMGSPLVWSQNPWLHRAFAAAGPALGAIPVRGSRAAAGLVLPWVRRMVPDLLSLYLNPRLTDLRNPGPLLATVEDAHRGITAELARWIRTGHLVLDGHDVSS